MTTGFFWDERCFWHVGGNYVLTAPVGGLVQPSATGGLPENPETKRRLRNLMDVTGISGELQMRGAPAATHEELLRVHPAEYLDAFRRASDTGGGELGPRAPFGPGGYEIAALSAGLSLAAVMAVARGEMDNAYALSRPPGHHCLPQWPNGFCLLNNIAVAIEAARAGGHCPRVAVIDWDVHHGNGTEAIYLARGDVLTISLHQEANYPSDTGGVETRGTGEGRGFNINVPLPPGSGHDAYLYAMDRIVLPALERYRPEMIVVACGFDAAAADPLSHTLATADTFRQMTRQVMQAADRLCGGRVAMVHEGGYSELYVPFCGHAVLQEMSGSAIDAPDPMAATYAGRQPNPRVCAFFRELIDEIAEQVAA